MSKALYFLATFGESILSVFGIRAAYEQPSYRVDQVLEPGVEIRSYAPRVVVETPIEGAGDSAAFGRLFRYITGANTARHTMAMAAPVEQAPQTIAMTVPVEMSGGMAVMRFVLPAAAAADPPLPTEKDVHIVRLAAMTLGVVRYSGLATHGTRMRQAARLRLALTAAGRTAQGEPIMFSYDPPFALPFVRRNEVALQLQ